MDLIVAEPVDHPAARVLQALGPVDVVLLIKAGPQLNDGSDLLTVFRRRTQILHEPGLLGQAVDGDLDGEDRRVGGGLPDQAEEGLHAFKRVAEKQIPALDQVEIGLPLGLGGRLGGEGRVEQRTVEGFRQLFQHGVDKPHAHGSPGEEDLGGGDVAALAEKGGQGLAEGSGALQPDHGHPFALVKQLLHLAAEVIVHIKALVLGGDIGVAGDADTVFLRHAVGVKDPLQVIQKQLFGAHIAQSLPGEIDYLGGGGRHRDDAEETAVLPMEAGHHIDALVLEVREGVVDVHDLRGEDGEQLGLEVGLEKVLVLPGELAGGDFADPIGLELGLELGVDLVPLLHQKDCPAVDGLQLLGGEQAGAAVHLVVPHDSHVIEAAHPDHKEFVQVAGEDGDKFQPLGQGIGGIAGLFQHPLIEREPGELAVLHVRLGFPGHQTVTLLRFNTSVSRKPSRTP